jgi:hypothetical protein
MIFHAKDAKCTKIAKRVLLGVLRALGELGVSFFLISGT